MPRPKPDGTMVRRAIAMTEAQWLMFDHLGGASWLRSRITRLGVTGIAIRERNKRMKAMRAVGLSNAEIARQVGVHRSTVGANI